MRPNEIQRFRNIDSGDQRLDGATPPSDRRSPLELFFIDLLPVLDALDVALPSGYESQIYDGSSRRSNHIGMILVKRLLLEVVARHGLQPIQTSGMRFDPERHRIVGNLSSGDAGLKTITGEFAKGYLFNDRPLRKAVVAVHAPGNVNEPQTA